MTIAANLNDQSGLEDAEMTNGSPTKEHHPAFASESDAETETDGEPTPRPKQQRFKRKRVVIDMHNTSGAARGNGEGIENEYERQVRAPGLPWGNTTGPLNRVI